MSGVEVAGLVLGSLPLLISALKHYNNGIAVAKRFRDCKDVFGLLLLTVRNKTHIFHNTCKLLLVGVVPVNEVASFIANPAGAPWKDAGLQKSLEQMLGEAFNDYMQTMGEMAKTIKEFKNRLKLTEDGKIPFKEKPFDKLYKKLQLSVSHRDYLDLIQRIKDHNGTLGKLTKQSRELEHAALRAPTPNFRFIQYCARGLYSIFISSWQCQCHHTVNLRLEPRMEQPPSRHKGQEHKQDLKFRVAFSGKLSASGKHPALVKWNEADAIVIEEAAPKIDRSTLGSCTAQVTTTVSGTLKKKVVSFAQSTQIASNAASISATNSQPIHNLCKAISQLPQPSQQACLGYLLDTCAKQRVTLLYPQQYLPSSDAGLSLRVLLQERSQDYRSFNRAHRLSVALTLASSVLQLHQTSWIRESWSKDDIYFTKTTDGVAFHQPFISSDGRVNADMHTKRIPRCIRNRPLFSLGVALIELWYGKTLEQKHEPCDLDGGAPHSMTEFDCAARLVEELYDEDGTDYAEVVRRCIHCDFDWSKKHDLGDEGFQKVVYTKVLRLLQKCYHSFRGTVV